MWLIIPNRTENTQGVAAVAAFLKVSDSFATLFETKTVSPRLDLKERDQVQRGLPVGPTQLQCLSVRFGNFSVFVPV